jgi:phytoene dehydrogenase-like protein
MKANRGGSGGRAVDVAVVGAGLAGLRCALGVHRAGLSCAVLEASDAVGGRVRTDLVDGFRLDRGFQVFLTAYPEAREVLDYGALRLRRFAPGALVRRAGAFDRVGDPFRRPRDLWGTLRARVGTTGDKLRVLRLRRRLRVKSPEEILAAPQTTALAALEREGFSKGMIDGFFRPLFGGVFLDRSLGTSSRMLEFVFAMFSRGDAALPEEGMGAIPAQLASRLPEGTVRVGARVTAVAPDRVTLADGSHVAARRVVVATDAAAASRLLGDPAPRPGRSVACLCFDAPAPPLEEPLLVLDGDGTGPVNELCVPSVVAPSYAPEGRALVVASVPGGAAGDLEARVRAQLGGWFGGAVLAWRHLRTYEIPEALPDQTPASLEPPSRTSRRKDGIFVCGDYLETGSMQGALASGRRAAEAITAELLR